MDINNEEGLLIEGNAKRDDDEYENNPYHVYDNAFLSACSWDKRLLIPLINEIFNTSISENADINRSPNEYTTYKKSKRNTDQLVKRITDALVAVDGESYHFECESKNDGEILIRVAEYDMQIALDGVNYNNHNVRMELPDTAIIFLRNHRNLPKEGTVTIAKGENVLMHRISYFQIGEYELDYLDEKHLYILMPFYLMRYEHAIKNNTLSKFMLIENDANRVYNKLTKAYNDKLISEKEYEDIITLCNDVVKEISKGCQLAERLVEIMGNEVLRTAEERGLDKGLKALVDTLKEFCPDFQSLYKKIIANTDYANVTEEQVKKYY